MNKFIFEQTDDETIDIYYNDKFICQLKHDDDGWSGMEIIKNIIKKIAKLINIEIVEEVKL